MKYSIYTDKDGNYVAVDEKQPIGEGLNLLFTLLEGVCTFRMIEFIPIKTSTPFPFDDEAANELVDEWAKVTAKMKPVMFEIYPTIARLVEWTINPDGTLTSKGIKSWDATPYIKKEEIVPPTYSDNGPMGITGNK